VRGRVYRCRYCVFVAPRDVVGAVNIKNRHLNNGVIVPGDLVPCGNVKYLRPADLRRRSSRPGAGQRCLGGSTRKAGVSSETRGPTPVPPVCVDSQGIPGMNSGEASNFGFAWSRRARSLSNRKRTPYVSSSPFESGDPSVLLCAGLNLANPEGNLYHGKSSRCQHS
jgi:hypothetical protein